MSERWRVGLLLAVAMLVYGNTLLNTFAFDDELYILRNNAVTNPSAKALFETNRYTNVVRPLTFATFSLNWKIGKTHAAGYHLFNLLLHAVVTMLLYRLFLELLTPSVKTATIAFAAALLFAVHPIHTEAVASIVGRSELLAAGFIVAAWLFHLRDRPIPAILCYILALFSKEPAVVFFPLIVCGDYARHRLKSIGRYSWIGGVTVAYLAVLWKAQGGRFGPMDISFLDNPLARLPAKLRILNACRVAGKYLGLHIFPSKLSCDYSYNSILLYSNLRHTAPWAIAVLLVVGVWVWALLRKRSDWALAGTIYIVGFCVTANILLPGGTIMGERLAYLPSAGFCLLIALLWIRLESRYKSVAWALLVVAAAVLAGRTIVRNRDWRDDLTLYASAVKVVPGSAKMHTDLGAEYMYQGNPAAARVEFQTALRIFPDSPDALEWFGLLEANAGNDAEARRLLETALTTMRPDSVNYEFAMVNFAAQLVKMNDDAHALRLLDQAIDSSGQNARAWSNRAVIHYKRGDWNAARSDAQAALTLDSGNTQAQGVLVLLKQNSK